MIGPVYFRGPDAMDMKSPPGTLFTLSTTPIGGDNFRFVPQSCYLFLRQMSGGAR